MSKNGVMNSVPLIHHFLCVCPWANHSIFLSPKWGIMIPQKVAVKIRCNLCKALARGLSSLNGPEVVE